MRDWHPRERSRQCVLAWGLVALGLMPVPPAAGQPALVDLLKVLNLSAYPSGLWWGDVASALHCLLLDNGGML
jgi:hypothetical protein